MASLPSISTNWHLAPDCVAAMHLMLACGGYSSDELLMMVFQFDTLGILWFYLAGEIPDSQEEVTEEFRQAWSCETTMAPEYEPATKLAVLSKLGVKVVNVKRIGRILLAVRFDLGGQTKIPLGPVLILLLEVLAVDFCSRYI